MSGGGTLSGARAPRTQQPLKKPGSSGVVRGPQKDIPKHQRDNESAQMTGCIAVDPKMVVDGQDKGGRVL